MMEGERAVQQVARGTTVETRSDAMSTSTTIRVVIPQVGPCVTPEEFAAVLEAHRSEEYRRLSDVEVFLRQIPTALDEAEHHPLSQEVYLHRARKQIDRIHDLTAGLPPEHTETVRQALDLAFGIGIVMTTSRLRDRHLAEVAREHVMQRARKDGGQQRRGKIKPDTFFLVEAMKRLIESGLTVRSAAIVLSRRDPNHSDPLRKGVAASPDAIRRRYIDRLAAEKTGRDQS